MSITKISPVKCSYKSSGFQKNLFQHAKYKIQSTNVKTCLKKKGCEKKYCEKQDGRVIGQVSDGQNVGRIDGRIAGRNVGRIASQNVGRIACLKNSGEIIPFLVKFTVCFSQIPVHVELIICSKLVNWLSKLLLKAGDIAENPGPVVRSKNFRNILSVRLVFALLFVYSVKLGENDEKCLVLNSLSNSFKDNSSFRMNKYSYKYQNFKRKIGIDNYISSKFILSMIIYLLLLQYGISPNPGPENSKKSNVSFITYNCRGLMDVRKLRRVLAKVGPLVDKNCIVALQETHKILSLIHI